MDYYGDYIQFQVSSMFIFVFNMHSKNRYYFCNYQIKQYKYCLHKTTSFYIFQKVILTFIVLAFVQKEAGLSEVGTLKQNPIKKIQKICAALHTFTSPIKRFCPTQFKLQSNCSRFSTSRWNPTIEFRIVTYARLSLEFCAFLCPQKKIYPLL